MRKKSLRLVTIKFEIIGMPDSRGFRIRSLDPWGIYVSISDPEVAKYALKQLAADLVYRRKLLELEPGEAVVIHEEPNWEAILVSGVGEISLRAVSEVEVAKKKHEYLQRLPSRAQKCEFPIQTGKDTEGGLDYQAAFDPEEAEWVDRISSLDMGRNAHLSGKVPPYLIRPV